MTKNNGARGGIIMPTMNDDLLEELRGNCEMTERIVMRSHNPNSTTITISSRNEERHNHPHGGDKNLF